MNLFVLAAVPLAAVVLYRLFHTSRSPFADPKSWIVGSVWSILALVAVAPFGKMREFDGNLLTAFAGLFVTDAVLVPGAVILAWVLTRGRRDDWELGLWLALVFTMAGIRDFASASRVSDLTELFLVPLDRILLLIALPLSIAGALASPLLWRRITLWSLSGALVLSGPLFQVLSWGGLGWLVWLLLAAGLATGLWMQKKAASEGSGQGQEATPS